MSRDHEDVVARLRDQCRSDTSPDLTMFEVCTLLAADLLEAHDDTGISLDNWIAAREFVERHIGRTIYENGA